MYINDINIVAYIIVAVLGALAGQISDLLNYLLPKHKSLFSKENLKDYIKNTTPKYLLMVIHILIYSGILYRYGLNDINTLNKNTIIYAHGRKDKVMFGSLTKTLKANWYKNSKNQIIQFSTLKYNTMWQIISIYKIQAESYYITTDFSSDESFEKFGQTMLDRSIYDFGVEVTKDDKLLTLSTCYNDNGIRLVVQAKLVKIQER